MAGRVTRFAPSPTGPLHLGHAFSALTVWQRAGSGTALLRIEDIDRGRCRPEWEAQIFDDLHWLGLDWPRPVMRQSTRGAAYREALERLGELGLTYPCRCSRADIRVALSAPQEGVPLGPDGIIYPGTCRGRRVEEAGPDEAIRLDMARAQSMVGRCGFHETGPLEGWHEAGDLAATVGDLVLARRGFGTSYHLAVVVDDAAQGVTEVVRGEDLFEATAAHVLLQRLLGLPTPDYHHHRLIRDEAGKRLAKREDSRAIAKYRAEGITPREIHALVGF
ncbi:tRNA glutamyl-Q(34) synthetase GluQRS [Cereibacter azotoformans]|uniref:Glutamate--tRNA ligase n=1 Tax=Cereibacter sphaeroides (strain ATCC 17025 / ATH 2.4.3) TaxID=349102 RepID=A4WRQ1_CERS5|nr:tRNA glutamyl-Q(34) synthetase GluQRS [Cereibacter azotoformans]ULB09413.1 tRNA glutamyl-Q(34) synthetase GluQRS [Cereibacter azotoformans]